MPVKSATSTRPQSIRDSAIGTAGAAGGVGGFGGIVRLRLIARAEQQAAASQ